MDKKVVKERRNELVEKIRKKVLTEIETELNNCMDNLRERMNSDEDFSFALKNIMNPDDDMWDIIIDLNILYALRDYFSHSSLFKGKKYEDENIVVYVVQEEVLQIMDLEDFNVAFSFLMRVRGSDYYKKLPAYLTEEFFNFEFISVLEMCIYEKELKEQREKVEE